MTKLHFKNLFVVLEENPCGKDLVKTNASSQYFAFSLQVNLNAVQVAWLLP